MRFPSRNIMILTENQKPGPGGEPQTLDHPLKIGRINRIYNLLKELRSLPEASIRIYGNDPCRKIYEALTKPHPKYKLIQHKRWGVALIPLPDSYAEYLKGKGKYLLRSNIRKAKNMQFYFDKLNPSEHIAEIMSINTSLEVRQGRSMNPNYLLIERVRASFEHKPMIYGVFDESGVLKAYADTPIFGEMFLFLACWDMGRIWKTVLCTCLQAKSFER